MQNFIRNCWLLLLWVLARASFAQNIPFIDAHAHLNDAQMRFWTDTMRNQDMLKKPPMVSSLIVK